MRKKLFLAQFLFLCLAGVSLHSQENFQVVVLGCGGGPVENNLSGYLLAPKGGAGYIALDAGSLLGGIFLAEEQNSFDAVPTPSGGEFIPQASILRDRIKAYLISHPHLDHVAGLVINSPADTKKPIFGIPFTIDNIRDHLFNWKIWPNFGSEGKKPRLNKYQYQRMNLQQRIQIPETELAAEAFLLNHPNNYFSTAFLLESKGAYILYLGDTAPDVLSPKKRLIKIWERVAPLIRQNKLRAIFLECSYTDSRKPDQLYGHLDPQFFMQEMDHLACLVDPDNSKASLSGLKVIVTHIKETLLKGSAAKDEIEQELAKQNDLGIDFIFPYQGQKLEL